MTRAVRTCSAALFALFASLPAAAQDFLQFRLELLGKGYTFTEGAAWSKDGYLVFSDTPTDRLLKWTPGRVLEVLRTNANGPRGNAFDAQGRLYTCETRLHRVTRTDKGGKLEVVADAWEGKRLNAPSHIAVTKSEHVYFTDPAFGGEADHRELDFYGVYHLPPKGALRLLAKSATRPNGIALSPNGKTLYVSDSDERNIRAYDLDRNGEASGERVLVAAVAGVPGGLAVDEKGNLYVAAKGVGIYSPEGRLIHTIGVAGFPSSCAFGEVDLKTLIVTSRGEVYRARQDAGPEADAH
jgi:gluconolactonase